MTVCQQWLHHPERKWLRNVVFQIHLWIGAGLGLYVLLMSFTGSALVYRNDFPNLALMEWLSKLHDELLFGASGRLVNRVGRLCLTLLCASGAVIWWPGVQHWRRNRLGRYDCGR